MIFIFSSFFIFKLDISIIAIIIRSMVAINNPSTQIELTTAAVAFAFSPTYSYFETNNPTC